MDNAKKEEIVRNLRKGKEARERAFHNAEMGLAAQLMWG